MGASDEVIPLARPLLDGNERKYLNECIDSGYVTHTGRFENAFEEAFRKRFNTPSLATSSGTGALHLALLSLGIGPGDEVLVPTLTFGSTASVVLAVGARPVLVDVDEATWGLDKNRVVQSLTRRTRAIISTALYGLDPGDFRQFGLPVIADDCEALGMVPIRANLTAYSFYGNKGLTTGEGGMLCGEFGRAREWRDGGFDSEYRCNLPGLNYRMSNMQAAVGLAQIERFDSMLQVRLANASSYVAQLEGKGKWLFCVKTESPERLQKYLKENGVETRPIFWPLHLSPAFREYGQGKYRVAEEVWSKHLSLPTGPHLTAEQQQKIVGLIHGFGQLHRPFHGDRGRTIPLGPELVYPGLDNARGV